MVSRKITLLIVVLLILVLLISGACNRQINRSPSQLKRKTFFTPTPTVGWGTSGSLIAFVGADGNLWVFDLNTRSRQQLTTHGRADNPAWSPDGRTLAYIYEDPRSGVRNIHLYDLLRGIDRPVEALQDPFLSNVTWSPDGRYLAGDIGCCPEGRILRIIDINDKQVVGEYEYSLGYAWSPDGKRLALGVEQPVEPPIPLGGGHSNSIVIVEVGKNALQKVVEGSREHLYWPVAWLPDGRLLYGRICIEEGTSPELWEIEIEEDKIHKPQRAVDIPAIYDRQRVLSRLPSELRNSQTGEFSWSPDGQWVVFHTKQGIYLLNWAEDGKPQYLVEGTRPVWQPHPDNGY